MRTRMSPSTYVRKQTPNKFLTATAERVDTDDTSQAVSLSSRSSNVIMKISHVPVHLPLHVQTLSRCPTTTPPSLPAAYDGKKIPLRVKSCAGGTPAQLLHEFCFSLATS